MQAAVDTQLECDHMLSFVNKQLKFFDKPGGNMMKVNSKSIIPAKIGQTIEWLNEPHNVMVKGIVLNRYDNSVCVTILEYSEKHQGIYENDRTVVNHKRYSILS